jgi:3-methyladenine DNA glycosylase AlkD
MVSAETVLRKLQSLGDSRNCEGMGRFGINVAKAYGVSIPKLRKMAKEFGRDHELAASLWDSGVHEARILACLIDDPKLVTEKQMESWVLGFDSWDVCDQCCMNLFDKTPYAYKKALEWSRRKEEFVRRAGFALMATLAVHDKKTNDEIFLGFLPAIAAAASDDRNFVKKSVNWALRQVGKRDISLNMAAIKVAEAIAKIDSNAARWIASDALRELKSDSVRKRLLEKYSS